MKFRTLSKSGPSVSLIGLGCINFGLFLDFEASRQVIHSALDQGINFFDSSVSYGLRAASEEFLGRALGPRRKDVIVATKFGQPIKGIDPEGTPTQASYDYIMNSVEGSLQRLRTDWIDLYQLHHPVPKTPIGETLRALDDLVKQGKVRHIGCSGFSAAQLEEAQEASQKHHYASFVSSMREYNLLARKAETDPLPSVRRHGLGFLPFFPLASGLLSGKYHLGAPIPDKARLGLRADHAARYLNDGNLQIVENLRAFAIARGHTLLDLAFSWLAAREEVSSIIAGAMTPAQIEQNVRCADWVLSATDMAEIARITEAAA